MKSIAILTLALATAAIAGSALAQQATSAPGQNRHGDFKSMDTNNDGVIDRSEAAAYPHLAAMFDTIDVNKDGRIDASERAQHHAKTGKRGGPGKGARGAGRGHRGGMDGIARLDTNGDGRVSQEEAAKTPRVAEKFTAMDANKDGYLVRSEVRAYQERMRAERIVEMQKQFDERFSSADLNKDGKLSKSEVEAKMSWLVKRFAWLDENRDGFLSREELQPRHR